MSSLRETLHPAARAELDAKKRQVLKLYESRIIDEPTAQKMYLQTAERLMAQARIIVSTDREMTVECDNCKRRHRMKADVIEYRCACNPHKSRFSFKDRLV